MGAFYFMYGFKAIAFYLVHTNPLMFVYGFAMTARGRKCTYLPVYTPVRKQHFGKYPLW